MTRIAAVAMPILPPALQRWRESYPQVQIRLVEHRRGTDLVSTMQAGKADLAVGPTPTDWSGPITEIGIERFVIVAPADSDLPTDGDRVRLADLANHPWVHFTPPSGLADILDEAAGQAGFEPRAAVKTEQAPSAVNLARAGLGITLVPGNVLPPGFDGMVLSPVPAVERTLCVYTRVKPDPIAKTFVDAIADHTIVNPIQRLPGG